jgi:predicted unusual protein kinase regulating ubiquinone biosynthesis (AarF/ABC1/UbiB family)
MSELPPDNESNRLSRRLKRYAQVGTNVGGVAASIATRYFLGMNNDKNANALAGALGGLKGPLMKVAQLLSSIPEALPAEYAEELAKLQQQAPPMGWAFVKRRMAAELGADWQSKFASFAHESAASASLGQVHKAESHDGLQLACKLQYPDMQSAVEADLVQLRMLLSIHKRLDSAVDTSEITEEIAARLREELNYELEARHTALYGLIFENDTLIRVPKVYPEFSTRRLLTLEWMEGRPLLEYKTRPQEERNQITRALFRAWWYPFSHYGVIHGDPHLGNYSIFERDGKAAGINLLDYGCMRTFAPRFVGGVVDLYKGLERSDRELMVDAFETWGFSGLSNELIDILSTWARFIYGPLLDNRVRQIAEGVSPAQYGRKEAFAVHKGLQEKGPVKVPREFVFMDRAAIGLGGVFLHLDAELNFYELFHETIQDFNLDIVEQRQKAMFRAADVPLPE